MLLLDTLSLGICLLLTLVRHVTADVELVYPASGATLAGGAMTLKWQDSGANPALVAIIASDVVLCTGSNTAPVTLYTLAGAVPLGSKSSLAVTIPSTIGGNGQYFIKFVSTTGGGSVVITYSDRFTLTGMTGTIIVSSGLAVTGPVGTTPPAALLETAAATARPAVTPTTLVNSAINADLAAYATQTGSIRSAPLQKIPGTAITALVATQKPMYPTSQFSIFTTYYGAPVAITTLTQPLQQTPTSLVNAVPAATFTGN